MSNSRSKRISGLRAITRGVSETLDRCELSHVERRRIDVSLARDQHAHYESALARHGCDVHSIPADERFPDAVFIEDTAVIVGGIAVITRPGAVSRRNETLAVRDLLKTLLQTISIEAPGTVDGGDVLIVGNQMWVGMSQRTNRSGFEQLGAHASARGYTVRAVDVKHCLHLKSAVCAVGPETVLLNPDWIEGDPFRSLQKIVVDTAEPHAANALALPTAVIYPASFPMTRRRLEMAGIELDVVDVSELQKAEGGVTCCSLIIPRK